MNCLKLRRLVFGERLSLFCAQNASAIHVCVHAAGGTSAVWSVGPYSVCEVDVFSIIYIVHCGMKILSLKMMRTCLMEGVSLSLIILNQLL